MRGAASGNTRQIAAARTSQARNKAKREAWRPGIVIAYVLAYVTFASARLVARVDESWYTRLTRPPWALPEPVQEAFWFVGFALLAYSSVATFRAASGTRTGRAVFTLRVVHFLLLQALVILLFRYKLLLAAAIVETLVLIAATVIAFTSERKTERAAIAVSVYALWVLYDSSVTWGLWVLNR